MLMRLKRAHFSRRQHLPTRAAADTMARGQCRPEYIRLMSPAGARAAAVVMLPMAMVRAEEAEVRLHLQP